MNSLRRRGGYQKNKTKDKEDLEKLQSRSMLDITQSDTQSQDRTSKTSSVSPPPSSQTISVTSEINEEQQDHLTTTPSTSQKEPASPQQQEAPDSKKRRRLYGHKKASSKQEQHAYRLKQAAYAARVNELEMQIKQVKDESSLEYYQRLDSLEGSFNEIRRTALDLCTFQRQESQIRYESEKMAAQQDFNDKEKVLLDKLREEVEKKIAKLQNDKIQADVDFELWQLEQKWGVDDDDDVASGGEDDGGVKMVDKSKKRRSTDDIRQRRKVVTVSGPYVVVGLDEQDILHDYKRIQRALLENKCGAKNLDDIFLHIFRE